MQKDFYRVALDEIGEYIQVVEYADDYGMQTRSTAFWRQLAPSADVLAEEGIKLYRSKE